MPHRPPPSPAVLCRPPPSSAVFRCFPLFSAVFRRPPPSPAVLHHPRPSPTVPYQNMSQIVGLVVLPNDGRPGNSRTRTDGILSSRLVPGSWQSPRRALQGPRTTENTGGRPKQAGRLRYNTTLVCGLEWARENREGATWAGRGRP